MSTTEEQEQYLVVSDTYPTTYGCHRGRTWTRAEMIRRSSVETHGPFATYQEALVAAQDVRRNDENFEMHEDDELWDDASPPWDSSAAENWDNDYETNISIMTKSAFEKQQANDREFLDKARHLKAFENKVEEGIVAAQVEAAGRVFYSYRPQPFDIPAELEINMDEKQQQQQLVTSTSIEIPANIASVKTIMFRCGKEWEAAFLEFGKNPPTFNNQGQLTTTSPSSRRVVDLMIQNDFLLKILSRATRLEELHLHIENCTMTELTQEYILAMLCVAPHLAKTLKVLAFIDTGMMQLDPGAVKTLGCFQALEHLDISNRFNSNYYEFSGGGGFCDDPDVEGVFPYDEPLQQCVGALPNLKFLHLGMGDPESRRFFHEYMLSQDALWEVEALMEEKEGSVTMEDERVPYPWPRPGMEELARKRVLMHLASNEEENPAVRSLAKDALADLE